MFAFMMDEETKKVGVCSTKLNDNFFEAEVEQDAKGNWYLKGYAPQETEEEKRNRETQEAKKNRALAVSKLTVEVDDMVFDGDEHSQERMARTITGAKALNYPEDATTAWVLADNTIVQVTFDQLARALVAAGQKQTELWVAPYTTKAEALKA